MLRGRAFLQLGQGALSNTNDVGANISQGQPQSRPRRDVLDLSRAARKQTRSPFAPKLERIRIGRGPCPPLPIRLCGFPCGLESQALSTHPVYPSGPEAANSSLLESFLLAPVQVGALDIAVLSYGQYDGNSPVEVRIHRECQRILQSQSSRCAFLTTPTN